MTEPCYNDEGMRKDHWWRRWAGRGLWGTVTALAIWCMGWGGMARAAEYSVTIGANGGERIVTMKAMTSVNSESYYTYTFNYGKSGVYPEKWIEDVQVYGYRFGAGSNPPYLTWRSLLIDSGVRYAGIEAVVLERYGNGLQISVKCSANTTGKQRSFRGKLNTSGDYLTVTQMAAGALVQVTDPANATSTSFTVNMGAEGGIARVVLKNNDTRDIWIICLYYTGSDPNVHWAPSYSMSTGNTGFNQSTTIAAGQSAYFYWQVPKNTTGQSRTQLIEFYTADRTIDIIGFIVQAAETVVEKPGTPSVSATTGNADSITVSWTGGSGATSFNLYRSTSSSRPSSAYKTGVTSPYVDQDSSLTPGVKYYYWVEAKNSAGSAYGSDWGRRAVTLQLGVDSVSVAAGGGEKSVSVTANTSWTATSDVGWIHFTTSSGSGSGTVRFTVDANTGTSARPGTVTVTAGASTDYPKTATFSVTQAGAEVVEKPGTPSVSATTGNADSITVSWTGGSGAASFNLYRSTSNSRPSSAYKTGVTSPYVDQDSSLTPGVKYYYWVEAKNSAGSSFSGSDWGKRAVTLQLGADSVSVAAGGGEKSVSVTANTGWTATSDAGWIHFTTGSGSGSGTVRFTVDANTGTSARPGTVTVTAGGGTDSPKTATFAVTQAAAERFEVGSCEMDLENGVAWLRFSGTKGTTYWVERARTLGGTWATALTFTGTNDGVNEVNVSIPGKWDTGFFRLGKDGGEEPEPDPNPEPNPEPEPEPELEPEPGPVTGLYLVVDMSGGTDAARWPVSELDAVPSGGWTDEYKTTKLVLRRIEAGTFTMGSPTNELGRYDDETQHKVTLTKPFYIGVFEVTSKQWGLAMGSDTGSAYPESHASYNDIRGTGLGANWPSDRLVDAGSFMEVLRAKTGRMFDLPTEAQWEYACRAGTATALNSGKNLTGVDECANMAEVGRYSYDQDDGKGGNSSGTTTVGSYLPNAWGLYDMHGNVKEWCLDRYGDYGAGATTDPVGASSGLRVMRGGNWDRDAAYCRSAARGWGTSNSEQGFRLALILPE